MEMVIAMAIITIVFSSILPLFRNVQAGWDARRGGSEMVQNGRVAMEHLNSSLAEALEITAVSNSSNTDGYIEFVDNTGTTLRCDLAANNYIQFGPVGSQAELAGPVTSLKFTCYALEDMDTVTTDVESIRFVRIDADFVNSATNGKDRSFSTSAHLRANTSAGSWEMGESVEYDKKQGQKPRLTHITDNKYLCVYEQKSDDGWACVLSVDSEAMEVTAYAGIEYSDKDGEEPFVIKLDTEHYMVFYFDNSDYPAYVAVLTVDTDNWTVSRETNLEWEPDQAENIVAVEIDSTHFLCLYMGKSDRAYAVVVELDRDTWEVTVASDFERLYNKKIESPDLVAIDATHFLYVYERDRRDDLYVGVLTIDTDTWEITDEGRNRFDKDAEYPCLARIDSTHYLCAFLDDDDKSGRVLIFEVDTDNWKVDDGDQYTFYEDRLDKKHAVELIKLEGTDDTFLVLFEDEDTGKGYGVALTVDIDADVVTCSTPYMLFDDDYNYPNAIWIEGSSYLCAYKGKKKDGFAFVFNYTGGGEILP